MLIAVSMPSTKQNLSVVAKLDHSSEVREAARQFFGSAGLDRTWINRLVLVADELFMNAVKYGCNPDDQVQITFEQTENKVFFAITDTGARGITPADLRDKIEHHSATHTPQKTSGRGLAVITKAWTDGYQIEAAENGGLTVSFIKKISDNTDNSNTTEHNIRLATSDNFAIKLTGEIDESNLAEKTTAIEKFLEDEKHSQIALDMAGVTFINSSVIGKIASWNNILNSRGGALKILNVTPEVNEILTLTGLGRVLTITTK